MSPGISSSKEGRILTERAPTERDTAPLYRASPAAQQEFSRDSDDDVYDLDVGLVGGLGLELGRAQLEARYTHGLRHINTDDNGEGDRMRNRVFSATVGFRLR